MNEHHSNYGIQEFSNWKAINDEFIVALPMCVWLDRGGGAGQNVRVVVRATG